MTSRKRRRSDSSDSSDQVPLSVDKRQRTEAWTFPDYPTSKSDTCQKLYDQLRKYKDEDNHTVCEFLIRAPNRRSFPDYYERVATPIDLLKIQQKLRTDEYPSVGAFVADVQLLLDNAKSYYPPDSVEYGYALTLERVFESQLDEVRKNFASDFSTATSSQDRSSPNPLMLRISKEHIQTTPEGGGTPRLAIKSSFDDVTPRQVTSTKSGQATPSGGVKLTRSKAWLEEYSQSDDPIKILFSAVYSCHDSNGTFVAEPFLELPSKKNFPEYFEIIPEPVDLTMIKRNIESGKYINLKAIQDDLILMVKNAHHFNEPNSEIFKMASALKKQIITKCAELERKYQTVVKTLPVISKGTMKRASVSESSGKPSPGVPEEAASKVKLDENLDEEESEGSSDVYEKCLSEGTEQKEEIKEEDGEEEEEDVESLDEKEDELLRKMKKEQSFSDEDPLRRVLKYKRLPSIKKRLMAIYRVLVQHKDPDGRVITELFVKRPSPKMYPEYYTIIKRPIDLREIYQKIREVKYDSLEDLLVDVNQMVTNACLFNEEGSQVYTDAVTLGRLAQEAYRCLQEGWPETRGRDKGQEKLTIPEPVQQIALPTPSNVQQLRMGQLLETVKSCVGTNGRLLWAFFRELPCAGMSQDYLTVVKKNIDVQTIANKLQAGQYSNVELLFDDITTMCTNICKVSLPDSDLYKDAVVMYEAVMVKYLQLTAPERDTYVLPNAIYTVQQILRDILMKTLDHKDASGKKPLDSLLGVTVTQEAAREKSESPPRRRTFGLAKMRMWAGEGKYRRLDQLQADLLAVLQQAREEGGRDSQMHADAVTLQRVFISTRDEICEDGKRLWSPALEQLTLSQLEGEVPMVSCLSEERESTPAESSASESAGDKVILPDETSREYAQETTHEGNIYKTGDIVYICPRKSGSKPHIALIEGIWKDGSGTFWLDGCWFYRPEETFHLSSRKFYEKEVFKSDFHSIARFSEVQGKCYVMFIKDYVRFYPEGFNENDVYVCESRYMHRCKGFKKIKVWNFLPGPQPKLVLRGSQLTLNRVPSVFAKMKTDGGNAEEAGEEAGDEEGSANNSLQMSFYYNFHSVPVSVTNPDHQCTYYEQFCIDDNTFRTGDFVYVRSDQQFPYIARIDRMWTDANDDPWFKGPWFVRPEEVAHLPTRMFLHKELFMSNIQDTNPMRSIIGKCAVLFVTDYCKLRPTEVPEEDVFVCECRYNEVDKDIRRLKGLRHYLLSKTIVQDESLFFDKDIQVLRVPSPKYFPKFSIPKDAISAKPLPLSQPDTSSAPAPAAATSSPAPTVGSALSNIPSLQGGNILNLNPALLQSLLSAVNMSPASKPIVIPLQAPVQTMVTTPSISTPQPSASSSSSKPVPFPFACKWENCKEVFKDAVDLANHLLVVRSQDVDGHLVKEADGSYYCQWYQCPRNPSLGGRPFETFAKILRHVREVHLMKLSGKPWDPMMAALQGRAGSPTPLTPSTPQQPSAVGVVPASTMHTPLASFAATPLPSASIPVMPHPPVAQPLVVTAPAPSVAAKQVPSSTADVSRRISHSEIYKRYIKNLLGNSQYLGSVEPSLAVQEHGHFSSSVPIKAHHWLSPDVIEQNSGNLANALWTLRDHMLRDSLKLAEVIDEF